jgi:two-component system sensor histidine kinase BaeS
MASRILLLASAGSPGFLHRQPVTAESVLGDALERWGYRPRQWRLGPVTEVTVLADRDRLALALDALLENAIAHTGSGGEIEVSARRVDGHVVLMVADSGTGIAPADLDRIFQRFARANPQRSAEAGGFGLGLALVQAIATAHGGSVQVRAAPGRGAAFEIILPLGPAPAAARPEAARPEAGRPEAGRPEAGRPEPVMTSSGPGSGSGRDGSGPDR